MKIIGVKSTGRQDTETYFGTFRLADVNYINLANPRKNSERVPLYHTAKGSFFPLLSLKDVSEALKPYGFDYIDKSTIINIKRVETHYRDRSGLQIVFSDSSVINVSSRSKYQ